MCECLNPCGRRIDTDTTKGLHVQLISAHRHQTKPVIRINSGRTPLALLATHLLPSFLPSRLARLTATHVTRNIPPKRRESSFFFFLFSPRISSLPRTSKANLTDNECQRHHHSFVTFQKTSIMMVGSFGGFLLRFPATCPYCSIPWNSNFSVLVLRCLLSLFALFAYFVVAFSLAFLLFWIKVKG